MERAFIQPRPRPKTSLFPPPPKKRRTTSATEEISFDFDARADYLTGFHKRKIHRAKQAQEEAAKKAREERIESRRQLREARRQDLEAHVEAVNALLADANIPGYEATEESDEATDEVWNGIEDDTTAKPIDHEEEYIDDDRYTTVTVEAVDVSKDGLHTRRDGAEEDEEESIARRNEAEGAAQASADPTKKAWPKKSRKKTFRYESKTERKLSRGKQRAGNKIRANARRGNG
ncbi:MAG: hypothetical protein M1818_003813 [Claussenomyces sp. TS43310]|nr:MAG: hypothetical protein M1818_003813 [Claussenomyces sp. TS43310]